ncbi:hypothetical protein HZC32_03680 [Candidatus Woesearchaeota archaeon]|nr:hypothetical protein [Candidatus Woesearchaeota archaeon]
MDDVIREWLRSQVAEKRLQQYPDEVDLIERHRESYEGFVQNLFREGHTHVGYGESHSVERLHASVVQLVPRLKESAGLSYVCLEIEAETQKDIDHFLKTGNDAALERVKEKEKEMLRKGYPIEGRVNGSYFDIIRAAKDSEVYVIAMDNHKKRNRDKFMASRVPTDGNTLIYVGEAHLIENRIPEHFRERTGIQMYRIWQVLSQSSENEITTWLDSIVEQSDTLKQGNGFGINLKKHNLHYIVDRHATAALYDIESEAKYFDGLLYHR